MNKHDKFKEHAALALAKLYEEHPDHVTLVPSRIVSELGEEVNKENILLCERSLSWLQDNSFFRANRRTGEHVEDGIAQHSFREARLTTLGFASLDAEINFKGQKKRFGDALSNGFYAPVRDAVTTELVSRLFSWVVARGMLPL